MAFSIGNIKIANPVILAPMSGVTDLPFRKLVKEFGAAYVVSEMVASRALIENSHQSLRKSAIMKDDATGACVQLAGCDPEIIARSAEIIEDMGAKTIDLNFGCPAKKVVGGFAGSALMRDEKVAADIFRQTVNRVKVPVTLKMRMGWDDENKNAPTLAKIAEEEGIKMITVHGRTRAQFYRGKADWKFIASVKQAVKIPVIANGDIVCFNSAKQALQDSGADGIMVGRGAYGKPWLINQIAHYLATGEKLPEPSKQKKHKTIMAHYQDMLDHYGVDVGKRIARKHLGWYSAGYNNSSDFRAKINLINDHTQALEMIDEFFSITEQARADD